MLVKLIEIDRMGRLNLSYIDALNDMKKSKKVTPSINVFCRKGRCPHATEKAAGADLFANLNGKSVTLEVDKEIIPTEL